MADGFSMAIIYKNFYKHTIFNEVKETFGSEKLENENNKNENCENKCNINDDDKNVLDIDSFTKQT